VIGVFETAVMAVGVSNSEMVGVAVVNELVFKWAVTVAGTSIFTVLEMSNDVCLFAAARFSRRWHFLSAFLETVSEAGITCLAASRAIIFTLKASNTSKISSGNGIPSSGGQSHISRWRVSASSSRVIVSAL
jgi:hypothetical protein